MKKKSGKILIPLLLFIILIIAGGIFFSNTLMNPVNPKDTNAVEVEIPDGSSGKQIASILKKQDLIKNEDYFLFYAKQNKLTNFKSGVYDFSKSQNITQILESLNKGGRAPGEKVTIKEGINNRQIADVLFEKGLADKNKFIELTNNKSNFTAKYDFLNDPSITTLEGFLYPETYFIQKGMSEQQIIEMMLDQTQKLYKENNILEIPENLKPYINNINQLVALASIVEKEAVHKEEKNPIAGVFMNRLKTGMPLQSDPTIEYVTDNHKERLNYQDTQVNSPYNTYINKGITPTPICNPTIETINAVKTVSRTDYLYFVAKKDGTHVFSKTYEEHLKNTKDIYGEY